VRTRRVTKLLTVILRPFNELARELSLSQQLMLFLTAWGALVVAVYLSISVEGVVLIRMLRHHGPNVSWLIALPVALGCFAAISVAFCLVLPAGYARVASILGPLIQLARKLSLNQQLVVFMIACGALVIAAGLSISAESGLARTLRYHGPDVSWLIALICAFPYFAAMAAAVLVVLPLAYVLLAGEQLK